SAGASHWRARLRLRLPRARGGGTVGQRAAARPHRGVALECAEARWLLGARATARPPQLRTCPRGASHRQRELLPERRAESRGMTLERELNDVLAAARLDPKQRRAVARRLGWDGRAPTTLAAAGAGEGYTRERVRQLA